MKLIKVSYRAVFQQLKSVPMPFRVPVNVEVIERKGQWISQSPDTGVEFRFTPCPSAEAARKEAQERFEKQLGPWIMVGKPPDHAERRVILRDEITVKNEKVYWLELDDFTHITNPTNPIPTNGPMKVHKAACGDLPVLKQFISLKANIEPTCPKCAEVYRERFAKK